MNQDATFGMKLHVFTCPHCSQQVTIQNSAETISQRWITCGKCGRQFRIGSGAP